MHLVQPAREPARDRILKAADACFRENGVRNTNVLEIVARAGVGRSTFYRNFRDLDEILVTLAVGVWTKHLPVLTRGLLMTSVPARQRWRDFLVTLALIPRTSDPENPIHGPDAFFHVIGQFYGAYPEKRQEVVTSLVPLIAAAAKRGELRDDTAPDRLAEWILRQGWALSSLPLPEWSKRRELEDYVETFVLESILSPEQRGLVGADTDLTRLSRLVDRMELALGLYDASGSPGKVPRPERLS